MNEQRTRVMRWLDDKHVSMWGPGGWDLNDSKEIEEAADWWEKEMDAFHSHLVGSFDDA